jgi:hypothetical protein
MDLAELGPEMHWPHGRYSPYPESGVRQVGRPTSEDEAVGNHEMHARASRYATRALDAAHVLAGGCCSRSFRSQGQWLPTALEPPM